MKTDTQNINWIHVAHLTIGCLLCALAVLLAKMMPQLPAWIWSLIGVCGVALIAIELPQAGESFSYQRPCGKPHDE